MSINIPDRPTRNILPPGKVNPAKKIVTIHHVGQAIKNLEAAREAQRLRWLAEKRKQADLALAEQIPALPW